MARDQGNGGINPPKVLLGGLLAGVLYNLGGVTIASLMDLEGAFARVGWEPTLLAGLMHLGMRFGFGFLSVFLYAAVRPRFGPGPRTALLVGVLIWLSVQLPLIIMMGELHILSLEQAIVGAAWGLFESCLATTAGAWVYRESSDRP
jgi:hypothetical protein